MGPFAPHWVLCVVVTGEGDRVIRRISSLLVVMGTLLATSAGCEEFHHAMRKGNDEQHNVDAETTKIQAVDADPKKPKPFFANNRLAGGWSTEAREIESHLGVSP